VPQSTEKRTAIDVRSSTNVGTTDSQLETCRRIAEQLGFEVIEEFIDEGTSGQSRSTLARAVSI